MKARIRTRTMATTRSRATARARMAGAVPPNLCAPSAQTAPTAGRGWLSLLLQLCRHLPHLRHCTRPSPSAPTRAMTPHVRSHPDAIQMPSRCHPDAIQSADRTLGPPGRPPRVRICACACAQHASCLCQSHPVTHVTPLLRDRVWRRLVHLQRAPPLNERRRVPRWRARRRG